MTHTHDNGTTSPGARYTVTQSRPNPSAPATIGGLNRSHRLQRVENGINQAYAAIERVGRASDRNAEYKRVREQRKVNRNKY